LENHNKFMEQAKAETREVHPRQIGWLTRSLLARIESTNENKLITYIQHSWQSLTENSWDFKRVEEHIRQRLCYQKAKVNAHKLRTIFKFRIDEVEQADNRDDIQKPTIYELSIIDPKAEEIYEQKLPQGLKEKLMEKEEATWKEYLQTCSFEQVGRVAHQLRLLLDCLVQVAGTNARILAQLSQQSIIDFANEWGVFGSDVQMNQHLELWGMRVGLVLDILREVRKSVIVRKDYLFFDVDKRYRETVPEPLWQQLLKKVENNHTILEKLANDMTSWKEHSKDMEVGKSLAEFAKQKSGTKEWNLVPPKLRCNHYANLRLRLHPYLRTVPTPVPRKDISRDREREREKWEAYAKVDAEERNWYKPRYEPINKKLRNLPSPKNAPHFTPSLPSLAATETKSAVKKLVKRVLPAVDPKVPEPIEHPESANPLPLPITHSPKVTKPSSTQPLPTLTHLKLTIENLETKTWTKLPADPSWTLQKLLEIVGPQSRFVDQNMAIIDMATTISSLRSSTQDPTAELLLSICSASNCLTVVVQSQQASTSNEDVSRLVFFNQVTPDQVFAKLRESTNKNLDWMILDQRDKVLVRQQEVSNTEQRRQLLLTPGKSNNSQCQFKAVAATMKTVNVCLLFNTRQEAEPPLEEYHTEFLTNVTANKILEDFLDVKVPSLEVYNNLQPWMLVDQRDKVILRNNQEHHQQLLTSLVKPLSSGQSNKPQCQVKAVAATTKTVNVSLRFTLQEDSEELQKYDTQFLMTVTTNKILEDFRDNAKDYVFKGNEILICDGCFLVLEPEQTLNETLLAQITSEESSSEDRSNKYLLYVCCPNEGDIVEICWQRQTVHMLAWYDEPLHPLLAKALLAMGCADMAVLANLNKIIVTTRDNKEKILLLGQDLSLPPDTAKIQIGRALADTLALKEIGRLANSTVNI
jgi:hypothetical protein